MNLLVKGLSWTLFKTLSFHRNREKVKHLIRKMSALSYHQDRVSMTFFFLGAALPSLSTIPSTSAGVNIGIAPLSKSQRKLEQTKTSPTPTMFATPKSGELAPSVCSRDVPAMMREQVELLKLQIQSWNRIKKLIPEQNEIQLERSQLMRRRPQLEEERSVTLSTSTFKDD